MLPWPSSMCERMNHWNFSSSGGLADEDAFGNGVNITNFCDSGAVVFNNTVVDLIKSAQVSLSISTIYAAFFPGSLFNQVAGQAVGGYTHGCYTFRKLVSIATDQINLRVKHLVNTNEGGAHNIPVCVLEGQLQIIESVQMKLQNVCYVVAAFFGEPGNGK